MKSILYLYIMLSLSCFSKENPNLVVEPLVKIEGFEYNRFSLTTFDPKEGCSIRKLEIFRSEIEKKTFSVTTGTVTSVSPHYPYQEGKGFYCGVQFRHNGRIVSAGLEVESLDRVKGVPKIGSTVRVEHYYNHPAYFIFRGASALYLKSIVFTTKLK